MHNWRRTIDNWPMKPLRTLLSMAAAFVVLAASTSLAAEALVWKLGEPDYSDHEFTSRFTPGSNTPVLVRIGTDAPARWPRFQPGSGNGAFGGNAHPVTLLFNLPASSPRGVFYLDLSLLFRQPRTPALELEINGRLGRFYFDPDPMTALGSTDDEFNPVRSCARRRLVLPAELFRAGQNSITFTPIDDPPTVLNNETTGGTGDSGLFYDALSLANDTETSAYANLQVGLEPTALFPKTAEGVREQCWFTVRFPSGWPGSQARISVSNYSTVVSLRTHADFGEVRCPVFVPDNPGSGTVRIELSSGNDFSATNTRVFDLKFVPARKWKVFYAPSEHMDIGYTDYRPKVAEGFARNMDSLMSVLEVQPDYRFNVDGGWVVDEWLRLRSPLAAERLAREASIGKLAVNALYSSPVTEYPSLEENIRNLYFGKELERRYSVPFDCALVTDAPSASWSMPSMLAAAGVRYFAEGINQDRAPLLVAGRWNFRSPFWWEGPDGERVLAWLSAHYHQLRSIFGLPPEIESGKCALPRFLRGFDQAGYTPDAVLIYGTQVENLPMDYSDADLVERWNRQFEWPHMVAARFSDFFRYIETNFGSSLPVVRGTTGAYWGDNFGILAGATARDRANQVRAVTAETVSALTGALDSNLSFDRALDHEVWKNTLIYADHNFGTGRASTQPDRDEVTGVIREKQDYTVLAAWAIDRLLRTGLSRLADQIRTDGHDFVLFNGLSWTRSALVQLQLDDNVSLTNLATGKAVEWVVLSVKDGCQTVRFQARDLPSVGYRVYQLGHGPKASVLSTTSSGKTVENRYYRMTLDPERAAIRSLYDKELGRELVDTSSPYRLNEYLFVSGGGTESGRGAGHEDSQLLHPFPWLPRAELSIHHPEHGELIGVQQTPWGLRIRMNAFAAHTPRIETEILMPNDSKRIEIQNEMDVDLLLAKQASYFAFPWAMSNHVFRYDIPNGFVNPAEDLLEGGCNDWFSVQHVVNVSDSTASIDLATADAPLVTLGDINRGIWSPKFANRSATVFSYALNNYWSPKWAGRKSDHLKFRYAVTSTARFDPAASSRFGSELRSPPEIDELKTSDKLPGPRGTLPATEASLVELVPQNLALTAFKPAEDGNGLIARIVETGGHSCEGTLKLPFLELAGAQQANAVEDSKQPLPCDSHRVRFHIASNGIITLRLLPTSPPHSHGF